MPKPIRIIAGKIELEAELADTPCAASIAAALPIEAHANTWGDEIYFDIGVRAKLDDTAADLVALGDIGYWPTGRALCFFFGPTPVSGPGEIRPASAVNLVGKIAGDPTRLKQVPDGEKIVIREA